MRFLFNIKHSREPRVGASRPTVRRSRAVQSLSFKYAAMKTKTQNGFSLLELMVAVSVAGIVLGFGVPSFMEFQRNNALISAANEMVSGLYLARTEAVKRQVPVTLCSSPDPLVAVPACGVGGNGGFIVFVDENNNGVLGDATDGNAIVDANEVVLLQRAAPGGTINLSGNGGQYMAYGTNGYLTPTAVGQGQPSTTVILYCDERGNKDTGGRSSARVINVAPTGRAQVMQAQADVVTAVAATGGICS
jgi:type IV fimbrial biogenesis protein FimT